MVVLLSLEECSGSCVDSGLAGSSQRAASRTPATCCVWLCLLCVSSVFSLHMFRVKLSRNFDPSACSRPFLHRLSSSISSSSMTAASPNLSLQNNSASLKFNSSSCVNRHQKCSSPPLHAPPTLMRLPIDCSSPLIWVCMLSSRARLSCQGSVSWFPCLLSRWHLSLLSTRTSSTRSGNWFCCTSTVLVRFERWELGPSSHLAPQRSFMPSGTLVLVVATRTGKCTILSY